MARYPQWKPTTILRWIDAYHTSTGVVLVETDAGEGFLKAMGNPAGEHALACELAGTNLAGMLGIPTLDFAIVEVGQADEIPLGDRVHMALPGPAFITRAEKGTVWSGSEKVLERIQNPEDIAKLVLLDTWIRNRDRCHPDTSHHRPKPDNVFLSIEGARRGKFILKAIDHTHCFTDSGELSGSAARIGWVKDERVFGLFPGFRPFLRISCVEAAVASLRAITREQIREVIESIPLHWHVTSGAGVALGEFVLQRRAFLIDNFIDLLGKIDSNG